MIDAFAKALFEHGREASLVLYLLTSLVFGIYAMQKEWLVLGKVYKRDLEGCSQKTKMLEEVNAQLVDQRILNERATARLEAMADKIKDLELDLARLEGREWPHTSQRERQRK